MSSAPAHGIPQHTEGFSMSNNFKKLVLGLFLAACCLPLVAQYSFQSFFVPNQYYTAEWLSINNRGAVVGVHYNPEMGNRDFGFKRDANGVFELGIDYPSPNIGTFATAINSSGDIYGFYIDSLK